MKKVIIIVGITCFFIVMIACNNFGQQNKLQDFDRNQKPSLIPINTDDLRGLKIEAFCNKAFQKIAARTPQYIAEEGLCKTFGIRNNKLNNLSDSYNSQTNKLAVQISELLSGYDKETCEPSQQITKGVLQWYIDDILSGHKYRFHSYPVNQLFFGYHNYLPLYFKTYIPITNKEEAKDYISCLQQINGQVVDLIEGLKHREELGIILPKQIMDIVLGDLQSFLSEESLLDKFHTPLDEQIYWF